jgi:phosphatidylglycerophosphate synthase
VSLAEFLKNKNELFKKNYARAPRYAKVVTHRVTPYVVYFCHRSGVTPNQVTFASLVVGFVACLFFAVPGVWTMLAGALTLELYYVLDSVDGQLARISGRSSKAGAFFDVLGNYIVHPLVFVAIGYGQSVYAQALDPLLFGIAAGLGYLWLGMLWEVRGHVLFQSLRRTGMRPETAAPAETPDVPAPAGAAKRAFSFVHKLCTYPTVMNVITLIAVVQLLSGGFGFYSWMLLFYGCAMPAIAMAKIAKMMRSGEIDGQYEALKG